VTTSISEWTRFEEEGQHMNDPLINAGTADGFKAGVHLGLFGLAVTCLAYNAMAYIQRKEGHLLRNGLVYAALSVYEVIQIEAHMRKP
jgi:hypothetical protein